MVQNDVPKKPNGVTDEIKKKKGFWGKFVTFLTMGGFILVLIVIVGILVAVSLLFKC